MSAYESHIQATTRIAAWKAKVIQVKQELQRQLLAHFPERGRLVWLQHTKRGFKRVDAPPDDAKLPEFIDDEGLNIDIKRHTDSDLPYLVVGSYGKSKTFKWGKNGLNYPAIIQAIDDDIARARGRSEWVRAEKICQQQTLDKLKECFGVESLHFQDAAWSMWVRVEDDGGVKISLDANSAVATEACEIIQLLKTFLLKRALPTHEHNFNS